MHSLTAKQTAAILVNNGFVLARQKGSHKIYRHRITGIIVPVAFHGGNRPIPLGTFLAIVKQSKILKSEFK